MPSGVLAFDLSPNLCGWAHVGEQIEAGAFRLLGVVPDLGANALALEAMAEALIQRFDPAMLAYEAPLLLKHDALLKLRVTYGLGMELERIGAVHGLRCEEMDPKRIKGFMTGDAYADKKEVVKAAQRIGVILPPTDEAGRKDAADAVGAGLVCLSVSDPATCGPWLAALRGSLL
jgi:Holliday junction resolvasome RuvABC endonuclease subunit